MPNYNSTLRKKSHKIKDKIKPFSEKQPQKMKPEVLQ